MAAAHSARRAGSMTIQLTTRDGTGSAPSRSRRAVESMSSGTIRVTLRTTSLRSSFILTASMAETPGRQMSRPATCLTHSLVIRISLRSAITSQSFRTTPAPTLHTQPHSMARKTSIMSVSVQHYRSRISMVTRGPISFFSMQARARRRFGI